MTNLTKEDIDELERLLEKATPGPWNYVPYAFVTSPNRKPWQGDCAGCVARTSQRTDTDEQAGDWINNAKLIAALHTAAPFLLSLARAQIEGREAGGELVERLLRLARLPFAEGRIEGQSVSYDLSRAADALASLRVELHEATNIIEALMGKSKTKSSFQSISDEANAFLERNK